MKKTYKTTIMPKAMRKKKGSFSAKIKSHFLTFFADSQMIIVGCKLPIGLCLFFITNCQLSSAQTHIKLQEAIDTALKNNVLLKNEYLKSEYQKALIKTGNTIPLTNMGVEYGQLNSVYYDTKFGLVQNINFPTIYSRQKSVLNEEWKSSVLQISVKESELKKQVSEIFYTLFYLQEKEKLLIKNDSFYKVFLRKSEARFNTGETNLIEKITAETQSGQILIQLNQLKNDLHIIQIQFQYMLNSRTLFRATEPDFKLTYLIPADSSFLSSHPTIKLLEQQKILSGSNTTLEKSRLWPDLTIGYYNMSIQGTGADNQYYNTSTRFQSAQLVIGIPIFYGARKAKINASKIYEEIATNNYKNGLSTLQNDYQKARMEYLNNFQTVTYYETTVLKNTSLIIETANRQYSSGEINYLQFIIFTNQAINLQNDYIDAVKKLNDSIIALTYLSNKNKL